MTVDQKTLFFQTLVKCGFKEIEVAYPAASDTDFGFVRLLIEKNMIPDDVWIQVTSAASSLLAPGLTGANRIHLGLDAGSRRSDQTDRGSRGWVQESHPAYVQRHLPDFPSGCVQELTGGNRRIGHQAHETRS